MKMMMILFITCSPHDKSFHFSEKITQAIAEVSAQNTHLSIHQTICCILTRDRIFAERAICNFPFICLSVRHRWISQKRSELGLCNFNCNTKPACRQLSTSHCWWQQSTEGVRLYIALNITYFRSCPVSEIGLPILELLYTESHVYKS